MQSAGIEYPLLDRTGGQAAEKISSAKQIDENSWQSGQQHGGAFDSVFPGLRDVGAERHQGRCDWPVRTLGKGDAIEVFIPDVGELPNHRDDQNRRRQRQNDPAEYLQKASAVDLRGLYEIGRNIDVGIG